MREIIHPLTSLRFFAALIVLISHYGYRHELFPPGLADYGFEAVAFFFILSGFVLVYRHGEDSGLNVSMGQFMAARIARLFPAYILALFIALPFFAKSLTRDLTLVPGLVLIPTMLQAWIPRFSDAWNGPAWSLSNEMFFYVLFPALWATCLKLGAKRFLLVTLAFSIAVSIIRARYLGDDGSNELRKFFPIFNLPQFMLGVGLAHHYIFSRNNAPKWDAVLLIASTALIVLDIAMAADSALARDGTLLCFVYGAFIYGVAGKHSTPLLRWLRAPVLLVLGEASYAMYILHYPIWMWWNHVTVVLLSLGIPPWVDFATYTLTVVGVSVVTLKFVEIPCGRFIRRRISLTTSPVAGYRSSL